MKRFPLVVGAIVTVAVLYGLSRGTRSDRAVEKKVVEPSPREEAQRADDSSPPPAPPEPPERLEPGEDAAARPAPAPARSEPLSAADCQGYLYGRVVADGGMTYEGRLRWGGSEEAAWTDLWNGTKMENPWIPFFDVARLPREKSPIEVFGFVVAQREREADLSRPFLARFGDLVRIESQGRDVRVTLKSGTTVVLDRFQASDFDDGLRIWDREQGVVDLDSLRVHSVEFLPTPLLAEAPSRLFGTVQTKAGTFTGFLQWNRERGTGDDELLARTPDGELRLRFDSVRSLERGTREQGNFDASRVTLLDGTERELSGTSDVDVRNRGLYVDDPRYGRVLVSWEAFERVEFRAAGSAEGGPSGPAFGDFAPGRPLTGSVTTLDGRRLAGRLVYDLDESESTDTLDAPREGIQYTIPFGRIAAIVPGAAEKPQPGETAELARAQVKLWSGEELTLQALGDLAPEVPGLLVFAEGADQPELVLWPDVARIDFDPPAEIDRPAGAL